MTTDEQRAEVRFHTDTADHKMTVLRDDGLYRHIRFQQPGTSVYYFDLVTWPGHLAVNGDMGCYVFARLPDMFTFFRHDKINPSYWAEKLQAVDRQSPVKRFSPLLFCTYIDETIEGYMDEMEHGCREWIFGGKGRFMAAIDDLKRAASSTAEAHELLRHFECKWGDDEPAYEFYDTWEWQVEDYSAHFLWNLYAIIWGISEYDKYRQRSKVVRKYMAMRRVWKPRLRRLQSRLPLQHRARQTTQQSQATSRAVS